MKRKKQLQRKILLWIAGMLLLQGPLPVFAAAVPSGLEQNTVMPSNLEQNTASSFSPEQNTATPSNLEQTAATPSNVEQKPEEKRIVQGNMPAAQAAVSDKSNGLEFYYGSQLPLVETAYTAGGGEIVWKPVVEGGQAVSGTLILKDAVIEGSIKMPVPVRMELEGSSRITTASTGGAGIYLVSPDGASCNLAITGSGSLEVNARTGIQLSGSLTVEETTLLVDYGSGGMSGNGIYTLQGDVVIRDSRVSIKSNTGIGSSSGAIFASQSGGGKVRIENSQVTAVNEAGAAIHTYQTIELISSDVRAVGNTNTNNASGTLNFQYFQMDGGTLYAENQGTDHEIPLFPVSEDRIKAVNNAVIYGVSADLRLPFQGDCVWYAGCSYEEASSEITVGSGYVFGNVTWNDNMRFVPGKSLFIGNYSTKDTTLTIPAGVTVEIPAGSKLNVRYSDDYQTKGSLLNQGIITVADKGGLTSNTGAVLYNQGTLQIQQGGELENYFGSVFENHGTVELQKGGELYNYYDTKNKISGLIQNYGELNISDGAVLQNQSRLENSGTINTEGNFSTILLSNYDAVIINTGTINGFVIEMHDTSYVNEANGRTVLKSGQTLTLGAGAASVSRSRTLRVSEGAELYIETGAVVDARTHVTTDTLRDYLDLKDSLVVDGLLLLPEKLPEKDQAELLEKISGKGKVQLGNSERYIVRVDLGEKTETQLIEEDGYVILPVDPVRDGCLFRGWYVRRAGDGVLEPYDLQTPVKGSLELAARWTGINQWTEPLAVTNWIYGSAASGASAVPKFGEVKYTYSSRPDGGFTEKIPIKAGTWYVRAEVEETEDYTGLTAEALMFRIEPKAYEEGGTITISRVGSPEDVKELVIKDGEVILQEGTDYKVSDIRNGNIVTVTITLMGNYTGTAVRSYLLPSGPGENDAGSGNSPGTAERPGPENGGESSQFLMQKSAQTGDGAPVGFWASALILSFVLTAVFAYKNGTAFHGMLYKKK